MIFEVAEENKFEEQVKNNGIIYFRGGSTERMINKLKPFTNLRNLLRGKIVGAESAGVNALSTVCYSFKMGLVYEGLKVVPYKVICHYDDSKKDKLNGYFDNLKQINLKEYDFTVLNLPDVSS